MSDRTDLEIVLKAQLPLVTIATFEEPRVLELLRDISQRMHYALASWTVADGLKTVCGDALFSADEMRLVGEDVPPHAAVHERSSRDPETALRTIRNGRQPGIFLLLDFHPFLDEPVHVRLLKEIAQEHEQRRQKIVFVSPECALPPELVRYSAGFQLALPDKYEIGRLIAEEAAIWKVESGKALKQADQQTVSAMVNHLTGLTRSDARRVIRNAIRDDGALGADDVAQAEAAKRALIGQDGLLSYEFDTARMSEVGGFAGLKQWLALRASAFTASHGSGQDRPRGIMLVGVQGGGKSLAAKAVAGMWNVALIRLDFGVLYNKFFGETERNIRQALAAAQAMAPCVLWCDEIEKGIATGDYDSGTSKRVLGTLLTWMAENTRAVFIVATANDISALPPELIRKGRLDEIFFVDLPDAAVRAEIFAIHLTKRRYDPLEFDLSELAAASEGFTGAECEQAVVSACYAARAREVQLSTIEVLEAVYVTRPLSVVMSERIASLRKWARGRTVGVG